MKIAVSFTGGKDSTLVLQGYKNFNTGLLPAGVQDRFKAGLDDGVQPEVVLLVTFTPAGGADSFKAHPQQVIAAQVKALRIPHVFKEIEGPDYSGSYTKAMQELAADHGIQALATGDILDVCSGFMQKAAQAAALPLLRPLWGIPRREMLDCLWGMGIHPLISCVNVSAFKPKPTPAAAAVTPQDPAAAPTSTASDTACHDGNGKATDNHYACMPAPVQDPQAASTLQLDPVQSLLGHFLTQDLYYNAILPASRAWGVDECGELGEFHTMVLDGPGFKSKVVLEGFTKQQEAGSDYACIVPSAVSLGEL